MQLFHVLLVLLLVARLLGGLARRLGQPPLVGELVAGVILGLLARRFGDTFPHLSGLAEDEVFRALVDLGVFFLMLMAGLEIRPRDLFKARLVPSLVAAIGVLLPLIAGIALGLAWLPESGARPAQAVFLGVAMSITAVPVAAKVLIDLGRLESPVGRTILTAAIVDDVLGLALLAVLTALMTTGEAPSAASLALLAGRIVVFFGACWFLGRLFFRRWGRAIMGFDLAEIEFSTLVLSGLVFAVLAESLGLHFMLGAFMAGLLFVARDVGEDTHEAVDQRVSAVTQGFLAPVFFVSIGLHLDLSALREVPGFVTVFIILAFLVKAAAGLPAWFGGMGLRSSVAIGVGMSARGAVELVVADIALRGGLFDAPADDPIVRNLFSTVVIMAVVTTLVPSMLLPSLLGAKRPSGGRDSAAQGRSSGGRPP